jgi:hypothetical protein
MGDVDVECGTDGHHLLWMGPSAELSLPRGPDSIKAFGLAGRELAKLVVCLLREFKGIVGDSQDVVVLKDGEEIARVDADTWDVGYEECATAATRRGEGVHVQITLTLVMWSRSYLNDEKRGIFNQFYRTE